MLTKLAHTHSHMYTKLWITVKGTWKNFLAIQMFSRYQVAYKRNHIWRSKIEKCVSQTCTIQDIEWYSVLFLCTQYCLCIECSNHVLDFVSLERTRVFLNLILYIYIYVCVCIFFG